MQKYSKFSYIHIVSFPVIAVVRYLNIWEGTIRIFLYTDMIFIEIQEKVPFTISVFLVYYAHK